MLKICLERLAAAVLAILLSPILLAAMVLVRLTSPGPAIYPQKRVGRGGRLFKIYKIRTMIEQSEPDGPRWSVPGDPRVTRIGRLLRRTHMDELPQLINVLLGNMSLVGPRPERPEFAADFVKQLPDYRERLERRPGLTGLAQVLLPPDTDLGSVRIKLKYDLYYVRHAGPWLDVKIGMATVLHLASVPGERIARNFGFPDFGDEARDLDSQEGSPSDLDHSCLQGT